MSIGNQAETERIVFESLDANIFRIEDPKTRLNTLQNYFFPQLERLLKALCRKARDMFGIAPLEDFSFAYRPAHRKDASTVKDYGEVYIGLTAGKETKPLRVFHEDGTPLKYSPSYLVLAVDPIGALRVSFRPYQYGVDQAFKARLHEAVAEHWDVFGYLLETSRVGRDEPEVGTTLLDSLLGECRWESPWMHFPLAEGGWLDELTAPFMALLPILDTSARLARGQQSRIAKLVERARAYEPEAPADDDHEESSAAIELPQMDSYRMIRSGRWYEILDRDKFTCQACGRSRQEHGVVLHVDHIQPRSKGGTDDPSNLRALCMKCNIGRSNRYDT